MDHSQTFQKRARQLKTRLQTRNQERKQREQDEAAHGLTQNDYWKRYVKSKADVARFFAIYHPEYPEQLIEAIATRLEKVISKCQQGGQLTEDEQQFFKEPENSAWDYKDELKNQETAAKINLAMKQLEELKSE